MVMYNQNAAECVSASNPNSKKQAFKEVKVIFLGDGRVGKTCTIKRIKGEKFDEKYNTTEGVSITPYKDSNGIRINIWDFGGQGNMYSAHRCFLTERSCYVVVVSNIQRDLMEQARYWLNNIKHFVPNAKVVIAYNQRGSADYGKLDKTQLREEFPNLLCEIVNYNAKTGVDNLKERIEKVVGGMDILKEEEKWSESLTKVVNALRARFENGTKQITKEEFRKDFCIKAGIKNVKDCRVLLDLCNDIGVCIRYDSDSVDSRNDKDNLKDLLDYMLLDPNWLTNAVYIIINQGKDFSSRGLVSHRALHHELNNPKKTVDDQLKETEYSEDELRYILKIMRKFRLSYAYGYDMEFIPVLFEMKAPKNLYPEEYQVHFSYQYQYKFLTYDVLHRLMFDCFGKLNLSKCWFKGICVDELETYGLFAVCEIEEEKKYLKVDVYKVGESESLEPRSLFRLLSEKIEKINGDLDFKGNLYVCSNDDKKAPFLVSGLKNAWKAGERKYIDPNTGVEGDVRELLLQVYEEQELPSLIVDAPQSNSSSKSNSIFGRIWYKIFPKRDVPCEVQELKKQLELFGNELKELTELNEGQKAVLYKEIEKLIGVMNKPRDKWEGDKKRFKELTIVMGSAADPVRELIKKYRSLDKFLDLSRP